MRSTDERDARIAALIAAGEKFTFENFSESLNRKGTGREFFGGQDSPEYTAWKRSAGNAVAAITSAKAAAREVLYRADEIDPAWQPESVFDRKKAGYLQALRMTAEALAADSSEELADPQEPRAPAAEPAADRSLSNKVFIVHGHEHPLRTQLEDYLRGRGLEPVVLHRQPDKGRSLIERFEHYRDVGYAFVLLTPDDVAYPAGQETVPDPERQKEHRGHQDVILEFGFLVGRLGANRVCCICLGGVALPSDMGGLMYRQAGDSFDALAHSLMGELQAAGYQVTLQPS